MSDKPTIALVAHDSCKPALLALARAHAEVLKHCNLVATHNTGHMLTSHTTLECAPRRSLALEGDLELAAQVINGGIDALIFLCDTTQTHPHQSDINALLRVSTLYDIPLATNATTARLVLTSPVVRPSCNVPETGTAQETGPLHEFGWM